MDEKTNESVSKEGDSDKDKVDDSGDVKTTEMIFKDGLDACNAGDFDTGLDLISDALGAKVEELGDEMHPDIAYLYFMYGYNILKKSERDGNIFGDAVAKKAEAKATQLLMGGAGTEEEEGEKKEETKEKEGPPPPAEDADADTDEGDNPNSLQVAWECVESARVIWEKDAESNQSNLIKVYSVLADILLEEDNMEGAIEILSDALEFSRKYDCGLRREADLLFRLGLAHSVSRQYQKAMESYASAESALSKILKEKGGKDEDLEILLKEIAERVVESREQVENEQKEKEKKDKEEKDTDQSPSKKRPAPSSNPFANPNVSTLSSSTSTEATNVLLPVKKKAKI